MTRRLALFVLPFAALLAADRGAAQGQAGFDNDADANRALSEARQQGAAARQRAEALEADAASAVAAARLNNRPNARTPHRKIAKASGCPNQAAQPGAYSGPSCSGSNPTQQRGHGVKAVPP